MLLASRRSPTEKALLAAQRALRQDVVSQRLLLGRLLARQARSAPAGSTLADVEFSVFSQFGDDGIIQFLAHTLRVCPTTFVEFGVGDYSESNTRFLMMNDNWAGFVMDSSPENIRAVQAAEYFWKYDLQAHCAFIDADNVNALIAHHGFGGPLGLLHIDLDGNDYWVWKALTVVDPAIVIMEYNSVFGVERPIVTPYDRHFVRTAAHHSNLYWGAALPALCRLASEKGYAFVGSNSNGNNAYFVRTEFLGPLRPLTPQQGYVASRFRESRDREGRLTYVAGAARLELLRGLPVVDVEADMVTTL